MSVLVFENAGEIDPRLITTFGANVKEGNSPFGYFGTGLKYAIAVTLRLGGSVCIQSGLREFEFESRKETMRGKEFSIIYMVDRSTPISTSAPLAFTLELGKSWRPWQAYREFLCNAWDEGGDVMCESHAPMARAGATRVVVDCPALLEVFASQHEYFLPKSAKPIARTSGLDVYAGSSRGVFYRGVRVYDLEEPTLYTYNIKSALTLSEDRTAGKFYVDWAIAKGLAECEGECLISRVLRAPEGSHERKIDFNWSSLGMGEKFLELARVAVRSNAADVIPSLAMRVREMDKDKVRPEEITLSDVEIKQLARAIEFLRKRGIDVALDEVRCCESLGSLVLGSVIGGEIWVARGAFAAGTKMLAGTVLEEWAHLRHGFRDESREMQNWLLNLAIGWGEEVEGEAL